MEKKTIGQFISVLRKASGMTQQELAERLNVSNKAVSRWERDECAPDISLIPVIAEIFGVSCDELLRGERINSHADSVTVYHQEAKKDLKVERQVKNLINRTLSSFKTLSFISVALALVGLIFMFGIAYGFYRPKIGFAVMMLFEVASVMLSVLALVRAKDIKRDNEIFEMADSVQISNFNSILGNLSFAAFYCTFAAIIISLPFIIFTSHYVDSVVSEKTYSQCFFFVILPILIFVLLSARKPYLYYVENGKLEKIKPVLQTKEVRTMSFIQVGLTFLAGVIFVFAPYLDRNPSAPSPIYVAATVIGLVLMLISVIYFIIFAIKHKDCRGICILKGIRNIFYLLAPIIASQMHSVGYSYEGYMDDIPTFYQRYDLWYVEYLYQALAYCAVVYLIFAIIEYFIRRKNNKT